MRYVSQEDLRRVIPERTLIQLSNDDPAAVQPDWRNVEQVVAASEELIDGFLRARYTLPLSPVPTMIREMVVNMARYRLYARRPEGNALPKTVKDQNASALAVLEMIQMGKVTLGGALDAKPTPEAGAMRVGHGGERFAQEP